MPRNDTEPTTDTSTDTSTDAPPTLDIPQAPEDTGDPRPRVRTPIGFTSDTGNFLIDDPSLSGVGQGLTYSRAFGSSGGAQVSTATFTQDFYYDAGLDDLLRNIGGERARELQVGLVLAGLLDEKKTIPYGVWDNASRSAFRELLAISNRAGTVYQDTLNNILKNGPVRTPSTGRSGGARRAPFRPRVPDRDEVKRSYKSVTSRLLGGEFVTDEEADSFADTWTERVVAAQRQAFDGQAVNEAPGVEAASIQNLEETKGDEVDANRFAGYVRVLEDLVGS